MVVLVSQRLKSLIQIVESFNTRVYTGQENPNLYFLLALRLCVCVCVHTRVSPYMNRMNHASGHSTSSFILLNLFLLYARPHF